MQSQSKFSIKLEAFSLCSSASYKWKRWNDGISFYLATDEGQDERHKQYFYTIEQNGAHPFLTSERAREAQTKFLHNWTRLGTPNNIHNWEIQIPNIIGGSFVVFLHILQVKRLYDGISFCLASEEEDWGGTIQYYNTIKQDCGAQSIL